jgi:hypothetical protein
MLKASGTRRLKLKHDEHVPFLAFKFNLRRYTAALRATPCTAATVAAAWVLTFVHYSAQPEPFLSLKVSNNSLKKCLR